MYSHCGAKQNACSVTHNGLGRYYECCVNQLVMYFMPGINLHLKKITLCMLDAGFICFRIEN